MRDTCPFPVSLLLGFPSKCPIIDVAELFLQYLGIRDEVDGRTNEITITKKTSYGDFIYLLFQWGSLESQHREWPSFDAVMFECDVNMEVCYLESIV